MNIRPNIGGCMHCGHDHFNRTCLTCHDTDGPCRAMLQWEVKVLGASLRDAIDSRPVKPPVPAQHPDPDSLERENDRLNEKLRVFTQTSWEAQAQVDSLLKQVKYLEAENKNLLAQNEHLDRENRRLASMAWETQKKIESLEADNKALRANSSELKALYEEKMGRYQNLADNVADELEKLGFRVFAAGACDND